MGTKVLESQKAVLLVIDVQGKLAGMMNDPRYLRHVQGLIKIAQILDIPILVTEQAPEKIGGTIDAVKGMFTDLSPIIKQTFSCCAQTQFVHDLKKTKRSQVIVCGIEAHVCVYQTVRDLERSGYDVHLAVDAVSSRSQSNAQVGIQRCAQEGAVLTSLEMLVTEMIRSTAHPKFREIMALLKENN